MDENEFEMGGVTYISVEAIRNSGRCRYCAFENDLQCLDESMMPECNSEFRVDNKDVIFIEKNT